MLAARGPRRQIRPRSISSRRSGSQPSDIAVDARVRVPTDSPKLKRIDIKVSRPQFRAGGKRRRRFGRTRVTISPSHRREYPWFHAVQFTFASKISGEGVVASIHERSASASRRRLQVPGRKKHFDPGKYGFPRCRVLAWNLLRSRSGTGPAAVFRPSQGVCVMLYAAISSVR